MDKGRSLHFTAPGLRTRVVDIAPEATGDVPESKRAPSINQSDHELDLNLAVLDTGTKARNRAFQERLDEVWSSTKGYDAKLRVEAREATETILNIREEYQRQVDSFSSQLQREIHAAFDKIDNELYPVQTERLEEVRRGVDVFVKDTVPAAIERQSGEVSRRLKKAYEAFDIEKQKEAKREAKFVNNANAYIQRTAQRFADESALMTANLHGLYDDVIEVERRGARLHLRRHETAVNDIVVLKALVAKESETRREEDVELLDCVIDTQGLLQKTVLEHFGSQSEKDAGGAEGGAKFGKLEARLKKQEARRKEKEEEGEDEGKGEGEGEAAAGTSE